MNDKFKKYAKRKYELDVSWDYKESKLFEYHKRMKDDNYNAYIIRTYDLQLENVLLGF
jgi:hypothetical protein